MQSNILRWCDEKITELKSRGIVFVNGVAVLPKDSIYVEMPKYVTVFAHRNDIPLEERKNSILVFFMLEKHLWPRLNKLESDIEIMKSYGGIGGFDLSPSIGMLRPRQRLSILVNSIYNSYCAINGIKVLPNPRLGDLGTNSMISSVPMGSNMIVGQLACVRNRFNSYGIYQLIQILNIIRPTTVFIYGGIYRKDVKRILSRFNIRLIVFPDRRNKTRNNAIANIYWYENGDIRKIPYIDFLDGGIS